MQIFYTINDWAGQNALFDGAMRGFYIAAIPILATVLAALLVFRPARLVANDAKIRRIAVATIGALVLCALLPIVINWFSLTVLDAPILSSRPYVTHWVNALVVEPNDNSFPSPETAMIGALFVAIWAVAPNLAWPSFFYGLLFCFARVFCGSNYVEDVLVGWLCGVAMGLLALSMFGVSLRRVRRFPWFRVLDTVFARLQHQTRFAVFLLLSSVAAFWVFGLYLSPAHFNQKMGAFWSERTSALWSGTLHRGDNEYSNHGDNGKASSSDAPREGEGVSSSGSGSESLITSVVKEVPRSGVVTLGGNLPIQAKQLQNALQSAHLAHSLVSIDVASLRGNEHQDKINEEHFAFVRFQVRASGNVERQRVTQTAARIVQIAFAQSPRMQNVDVVGVVLNDPARDGVKYPVFAEGMIPVFTASIQRSQLILTGAAAVFNAPTTDAGTWLRERSRLYFNERVLPAKLLAPPTSVFPITAPQNVTPQRVAPQRVTPTPTPKVIPPIATPQRVTPTPQAVAPTPKVVPPITVPPIVKPSPISKSTPKPTVTPIVPTNKIAPKSNGLPKKFIAQPRRVVRPRTVYKARSSTRLRRYTRPRRVYRAYRPRFYGHRRSYRRYRRYD